MIAKAHIEFSFKVWNDKTKQMVLWDGYCYIDDQGLLHERIDHERVDCLESGYKILRCTNLKDINDKLIYDGDIVKGNYKHDYGYAPAIGVMRWRFPVLFLTSNTEKGLLYHAVDHRFRDEFPELEIIGNIYENPELIQEGSEK